MYRIQRIYQQTCTRLVSPPSFTLQRCEQSQTHGRIPIIQRLTSSGSSPTTWYHTTIPSLSPVHPSLASLPSRVKPKAKKSRGTTSKLPFWEWRKLPHEQRWSHVKKGVFHLVAPTDTTEPKFDLMQGVPKNLFKDEATIHRIIGFESDIIEESARDTTATSEIAIVGRSNVGKSSLINALLVNGGERKELATTSNTPGRTQLLFMFSFKTNRHTRLVDCPGYGYANVSQQKREAWNKLMGLYLRKRAYQGILKRVMVLIDIRRGIGPIDEAFMKFLESEQIPYQVVLTKVDSVTPQKFAHALKDVRDHLQSMPLGRFTSAASREEYEKRIEKEASGEEDEPDDDQWQKDVDSGAYSDTSLPMDSSLPSYSCSIPIIHAVSSRLDLGITSLQQSMSRIMTVEKNLKKRPYPRDGEETQTPSPNPDDAGNDMIDVEDDGMDNVIDEQDAFIPPIPVSHYDDPSSSSIKPKSSRMSSSRTRSKFGARRSALKAPSIGPRQQRGFATSTAKEKKPRSKSTPPNEDEATTAPTEKKPRKSRSTTETSTAKRSSSTPPHGASKPTSTSSTQPSPSTVASSASQDTSSSTTASKLKPSVPQSSSNDAHLATIYQKKTQRQHILDRPETYIGSMHHQISAQWVYEDGGQPDKPMMIQKECVFVPSLVHIFDEILVNAADNQHRLSTAGEDGAAQMMSTIRVDLDESTGRISIFNDGAAIPTAIHPTEGIPIPTLIFGHLLTSSNYNDKEQRFTGGRHGYGAKLTNIFSREFTVEIQDVARETRFSQTFKNNMSEIGQPILTSFADLPSSTSKKSLANNYTKISFIPDFARFNEKGLTKDTIAIMKKRVFDISACVNTNIATQKLQQKSRKASQPQEEDMVKRIKVYLNGHLVEVDSFPKYLNLFPSPTSSSTAADGTTEEVDGKWVFSNVNSNWQVAVGPNVSLGAPVASSSTTLSSDTPINTLPPATRDISFVNSIYTSRGGTHVNHVADRITRAIIEHILKTQKSITKEMIPAGLVKQHMSLLVNCKIPNPSFSSQTKESLMTPVKDFGSECTLTAAFLSSITSNATGIVPAIVDSITSRQQMDLLKKSRQNASKRGKLLNIPKLDDAHWAGSSDPEKVKQTTLILTEGDSAKALVLSSLSILGRDKFGVFPLKGKLLNVRDASLKQVMDNAEIQNILAIVGLEIGARYSLPGADPSEVDPSKRPSKSLRYGRIMLMTDQDHDGSHIKGLFINLLHTFWPELLHSNQFLEEFVTAIIKVKNLKTKEVISFQTQTEFETWKSGLSPDLLLDYDKFKKHFSIKYYKGLGTNTNEEGKEYFKNIVKHRVKFVWGLGLPVKSPVNQPKQLTANNGKSLLPAPTADAGAWIRLAFSRDQADARKEWLQTCYNSSVFVDTTSMQLKIDEFINKELIVFSHADNIRSIPSVLDGLKPVQRKILFGCFKRGLKSEIKVAQLSGYISEQTMYHHGEVSLQGTIINMAQNFIGSNNIALLVGAGQFGSRNTGGKDAAAARYIFTTLSPITRAIFHPHDDPLLTYKDEDGFTVEPEFYLPIIPTVLVNGAEGIGTGFSTNVPTFNPKDLIDNLKLHIQGQPMKVMHPWIRGWRGVMKPQMNANEDDTDDTITSYMTEGVVNQISKTSIEIRELPVGKWPETFKTFLGGLQSDGEIKKFYDQCTDEKIHYRIELTPDQANQIYRVGPVKFFKLSASLSLENMHLFDGLGFMKKYRSVLDILKEFAVVRLEYYRRRREYLLIAFTQDLKKVDNKMKFIRAVTEGSLKVYNKKKKDLMDELRASGYETAQELLPRFPIYRDHTQTEPVKYTNQVKLLSTAPLDSDAYDYLLNLPLSTLTAERLHALQSEQQSTRQQLDHLKATQPKQLWFNDLIALEKEWNEMEQKRQKQLATGAKAIEQSDAAEDDD